MKLAKAISRRIRDLREAAGLSQQDVAMRAELSMSLVAKLEQGKKADPRASTLLALAHALGVPPGKLLDDLFSPPLPKTEAAADLEAAPAATPPEEANGPTATLGVPPADAAPKVKKKKKKKNAMQEQP
jgi:transcriptional regulator with XRE-family HTH domain